MKTKLKKSTKVIALGVFLYIIIVFLFVFFHKRSIKKSSNFVYESVKDDSLLISKIGNIISASDNDYFEKHVTNSEEYTIFLWIIGSKADAEIQVWGEYNDTGLGEIDSMKILSIREPQLH